MGRPRRQLARGRGALVLLAAAIGALLVGGPDDAARTYELAAVASARGDWPGAFERLAALAERSPGYRDVAIRLRQAALRAVPAIGSAPATLQARLVRELAGAGEPAALADALDRCQVAIPAGRFVMGTAAGPPDERPQRLVTLDAFVIDRFETTNAQYQRYLRATGRPAPPYWSGPAFPDGEADAPVVGVGWNDANGYCAWAGKRLPTEAEWERACRGTDGATYPWGPAWRPELAGVTSLRLLVDDPAGRDPAWALLAAGRAAGGAGPSPVWSVPGGASPDGVFGLVGGAAEWVVDWYGWTGYAALPDRNPVGTGPPWNHVLRGVPWLDRYAQPEAVAGDARCAGRDSAHALSALTGIRCAGATP
jgi:formylglycine-generating enzyme required for sulfatase activity